ncbi:acyltransferase family protein [Niveispirillum fermenti]|uniref:acyltransferase family protein n=1 Tax=Niveispirillum fermenti TaxID=1233113 RepID=UPI003A886A83
MIAPVDRRFDRPELDVLRFLAFVGVFAFHYIDYAPFDRDAHPVFMAFCTIGAFGVSVFFLLSAYLITELLYRERQAAGRVDVKRFFIRRSLRIWPLYFATLFGLLALGQVVPKVAPDTWPAVLTFLTFTGNWYVMDQGWIAGSFDPLWSISVEEQFYILVPFAIALLTRRWVVGICLGIIGLSYATILHYAMHPVAGDNGMWTNSLVQFQFFAAGTLLSIGLRGRVPDWGIARRSGLFAAGLGCWLWALWGFGVKSWDAHPTPAGALAGWALVLLGAVLFFLALLGMDRRLAPPWLTYWGRVSYGLYLFHSLVMYLTFGLLLGWFGTPALLSGEPGGPALWAGTALSLLVLFTLAHLSYRYFESPFLRLKQRYAIVRR